jgi:translation initiation factor 6 (eIF-6)
VSVQLKGRHWVAIVLGVFLSVALIVVWRQSEAQRTFRNLEALRKTRSTLEVQKSTAIGDISRARSRSVLVPLAEEKLGLRLPQDSEITILKDLRRD